MGFSQRGRKLAFDALFVAGRKFHVALVTAAQTPNVLTTETLGDLTEIAAGNGYASGGPQFDGSDFDVQLFSSDPDYVEQQLADIVITASGGNIPGSGDGASYLVLTTDEATVADRQVIAFADVRDAPLTILDGLSYTVPDFFIRIGGNLAEIPENYAEAKDDIVLGDGAFGAYVNILPAIGFEAHELCASLETSGLATGDYPVDVEVVIDPTGTPVVIKTIHIEASNSTLDNGPNATPHPFRYLVPSGSDLGARGKSASGTDTVNVHIEAWGPN